MSLQDFGCMIQSNNTSEDIVDKKNFNSSYLAAFIKDRFMHFGSDSGTKEIFLGLLSNQRT